MAILIKSGTIITAETTFRADILIDGEVIVQIGADLEHPNAKQIDASEKLITPGGVDPHTHFDLPMFDTVSSDDHYTGHKAAASGGTTTVIDFVPQDYPTLRANVDAGHAKADAKAAVDFGFHMNLTHFDDLIAENSKVLFQWASQPSKFSAHITAGCACRLAKSFAPCASPNQMGC